MKTTRVLILEDDLETLSVIMQGFFELEEKLHGKTDFAVTVFSEYTEAENYLNKLDKSEFDIVLLDRDCKLGGSFHILDFDKFGKDKIISISSTQRWNEEAKAGGITRIIPKDYENISDFKNRLKTEITTSPHMPNLYG